MKLKMLEIITIAALLNGCGGGSSTQSEDSLNNNTGIKTGIFLDSPVEGVSYTTATQNGVTGSDGSFKYRLGEDIEFYIGDIILGKTEARELITPINLTGAGSLSDPKVINILQVLQTADEDQNPDNGIKIIQSDTPLTGAGSLNLSVDYIDVEDLFRDVGFLEKTIVKASDAIAHFQGTVKDSISGVKSEIDDFRVVMQSVDSSRKPISENELALVSRKYYNQAYLSDRIYSDSTNDIGVEKKNWTLVDLRYQTNGFKAGIYQDSNSNNYAIVFGGTTASIEEFSDSSKYIDIVLDIITDIKLFSNMPINPNQANSALEFLDTSIVSTAIQNSQVDFITGHSLGGGLAQYAGLYTGIDTVTFNTAPLPFNNNSIEPFLNKYNYDTGEFALWISAKNSNGDVTEFEFPNKNKIVNIMASKDPVSLVSLAIMEMEAAEDNVPIDTFFLPAIKLVMLVANQLKLNYLIKGEKIYLPIDTGSAAGDHSISTILDLFSNYYDPNEIIDPIQATKPLNDTGITWGGEYPSGGNAYCYGTVITAQDCSHGRDAAAQAGRLPKVGAGHAGFDFTKLDSSGNDLPASATGWSCVRDNVTGLVWEVKTDDDTVHDKDNTYTWYNTDSSNNGGDAGDANGGLNTQAMVSVLNASGARGWCGGSDWRLPNRQELRSIANLSRTNPAIDTDYFPNTQSGGFYWSSSPGAGSSSGAWGVYFYDGDYYFGHKNFSYYVRLVRGGQ